MRGSRRALALSFGVVAETYNDVRPPYFVPLVDRAHEVLNLDSRSRVLDLGAGTGRLTRELVGRCRSVIAVEPDDEMRSLISVGTVLAGAAEAIPLADASVDAVFVGEAFHWFDARRAVAEIARVLRPRGGLAVIATHWWETNPPLPEPALTFLRAPHERTADQRRGPWQSAFDGSSFEPLRSERYEEEITVDADRLLELFSTTSAIAALDDDQHTSLLTAVRSLLAGPYRLPIKHELSWTRLA